MSKPKIIDSPDKVRVNDKIIAYDLVSPHHEMITDVGIQRDGPNGLRKEQCNKIPTHPKILFHGVQFIDHITKSTKWSGASLRSVTQEVRAIRMQFFNANVVLVDTPGFDNTYRSDFTILDLIGNWLKKT